MFWLLICRMERRKGTPRIVLFDYLVGILGVYIAGGLGTLTEQHWLRVPGIALMVVAGVGQYVLPGLLRRRQQKRSAPG